MRAAAIMLLAMIIASCSSCESLAQISKREAQDPAVSIIVDAFLASGSRFIIVNEDHSIDWHRHVSACILDQIAQAEPTIFGAEAYHEHKVIDAGSMTPTGYAEEPLFQHIWGVVRHYDLPVFGYDATQKLGSGAAYSKTVLSREALIERGLRPGYINKRDAKAAENILRLTADYPEHTVYLHVGFSHASEKWDAYEQGGEGWLAAQLARLTGENPITVYQMGPEQFAKHENAGLVEWNVEKCSAVDKAVPILRTGKGQVGCIKRQRHGARAIDSDYIIADPSTGLGPFVGAFACTIQFAG